MICLCCVRKANKAITTYPFGICFLALSTCSFDATFIVINSLFTGCGVSSFTSSWFGNGSCSSIAKCKPPIESAKQIKKRRDRKNQLRIWFWEIHKFLIGMTEWNEQVSFGFNAHHAFWAGIYTNEHPINRQVLWRSLSCHNLKLQ